VAERPLFLRVKDFHTPNAFRWVLEDEAGGFIADHTVRLDPADDEYRALFNLPEYFDYITGLDASLGRRGRLLSEIGEWVGHRLLGDLRNRLAQEAPVVVHIVIPPIADALLALPLEIAYVDGAPLALQNVGFAFEIEGEGFSERATVSSIESVRMLAIFSVPPSSSPLNLRRERQLLRMLVRELRGASSRDVELHVLQYGTTRESVRAALMQGKGWDVIHFSGHGSPGSLILERTDGSPDPVSSVEVAQILRASRVRPKLVMLSACLTAATSVQQALNYLNIDYPDSETLPTTFAGGTELASTSVARVLVQQLRCAVVAMRYPVEDDFAMAFSAALYKHLFIDEQTLADAVSSALQSGIDSAASADAVSIAAPVLFGRAARTLRLIPPRCDRLEPEPARLGYFPPEPLHFVGRVAAMTRASSALALRSDRGGVLFYGMAGGGKTACALELAYHHEATDRFRGFVWYSAPKRTDEIAMALRDFAVSLETQIHAVVPNVTLASLVDSVDDLRSGLPRITAALERNAVLIVIDNIETLLTEEGRWRDERWSLLIGSLLSMNGLSRVVMTSRIRPGDVPDAVENIAVNALPLSEAVLLVRQLPHLSRLLTGEANGVSAADGRHLLRRTLELVQGHPKLLSIADGLAREPQRLALQLERAGAASDSHRLDAFFKTGETLYDPGDFIRALYSWTSAVLDTMSSSAQCFFYFLCALEEGDRQSVVLTAAWPRVWQRLGHREQPPEPEELFTRLEHTGLTERYEVADIGYAAMVHPGVVEAACLEAGDDFRIVVHSEMARSWLGMMTESYTSYGTAPHDTAVIIRAGLSALAYLSRLREWDVCVAVLQRIVALDDSPNTLSATLPLLRRITDVAAGTSYELHAEGLLGKLLHLVHRPKEAADVLQRVVDKAATRGDFATASRICGDLINALRDAGRLEAALALVDKKRDYSKSADLGPWTTLSDEGHRLQILSRLGRNEEALAGVESVLLRMEQLDKIPESQHEQISEWNFRETVFNIGANAATRLKLWERALELSSGVLETKRRRGATGLDLARIRCNEYHPLKELGLIDEAAAVLSDCRRIAEEENDLRLLCATTSAYADLESHIGHVRRAVDFEKISLGYAYAIGDPSVIQLTHRSLAFRLTTAGACAREVFAHLIATTLFAILGNHHAAQTIEAFSRTVSTLNDGTSALPRDFTHLCTIVEESVHVPFKTAVENLVAPGEALDAMLQSLLSEADAD